MSPHKKNITTLILITLLCLTIIPPSSSLDWSLEISHNARINPSNSDKDLQHEFLVAHNAARAEVGVGPVVWDAKVAAYAAKYASRRAWDCAGVHSHGSFGENIAWSGGDMGAADAEALWIGEKPYYDYESNTCHAPPAAGGTCLHYTQVVWRNTARIGCAKARCRNGGTFITCNYDPPGNYIGQRPY